jgi:protein-S-isoprenylcysteine O-methyltransferase Ste14
MTDTFKSYTFVLVQFVCLGIFLFSGSLIPSNYLLITIEVFAVVLAIWAVLTMRIGTFNVRPNIKPGSNLVTRGPYKFIRHPMYSSVLLATLPLILNRFSLLRCAVWLVLVADLILKLRFEEQLLCKAFVDYQSYMQRTKRLIPFIY